LLVGLPRNSLRNQGVLPNFEIISFRALNHLVIERLGRVNLIIGKNNVGKTTLLEALRFFGMASPTALREYLVGHDELSSSRELGEAQLDFRSLFHGRRAKGDAIRMGPIDAPEKCLQIRLVELERIAHSSGRYHYEELEDRNSYSEGDIVVGVRVERKDTHIDVSPEPTRRSLGYGKYVGPAYIRPEGVRSSDLTQWWDDISLTGSEDRVLQFMSSFVQIDRVATRANPMGRESRILMVRLRGDKEPVPLKSLGGGPVRLFQIAVALEYSSRALSSPERTLSDELEMDSRLQTALLLIDEVENGVHHSLHCRLWKSLLQIARGHGIQVFATTHSADCLRGFADAVAQDEEDDAVAIRLEKIEGQEQTGAVIIDRNDLSIVVRDSIEVR
jgi:hypothetical protein